MRIQLFIVAVCSLLLIQACRFSYFHHNTRMSPDWWPDRQLSMADVYEILYFPTMIKFSYTANGKDYKHYVHMSRSFPMPVTAFYDIAFNPEKPKENVILLHRPHFYDDEKFIYTVGTADAIESYPRDLFSRSGNDSSFMYYVDFKLEDGRMVPGKWDGLLQIQPYTPSYYAMYEKGKKYLLMYSPKEWTRCWMFLDYPVDGLSEAEIQAKIEELKQNNYMLRKRL